MPWLHTGANKFVTVQLKQVAYISPVNCRWPPKSESSVGDLIQTRSLRIGQFLVLHGLFKSTGLLPEQTFPCGEVCSFKECVFQDALHTSKGLDHVCPVVVQVPKFAVVSLMCPPEGILFENLQEKDQHGLVISF